MDTLLRIGVLAERTGVSTHLLRVWEERYGLLTPQRSSGGYRLYDADDERRVGEMVALRGRGVAAADAAAIVLSGAVRVPLADLCADLDAAFLRYEEATAHAIIDRALATHDPLDVVEQLFFPCLRTLGTEWEVGGISVAQEHFASGLIRSRMLALAPFREAAVPGAPVAVLACPTHERHDIGLIGLCLLLRHEGWSVTFLGGDTPIPSAVDTAVTLGARIVVLVGTEPHMFAAQLEQYAGALTRLPVSTSLVVGGRAATETLAGRYDAVLLAEDLFQAADGLAGLRDRVRCRA
jgi:DNA-binding transcriptional MerR regulator